MAVNRSRISLVAAGVMLVFASNASAQVFGTFSWRMEPYCNIVTMTITQIPGGYTIDGNDNQCGLGGKLAGAAGMALLNPDSTVGLEFTIVTAPSGKAVHVSASVSPATGSGPWTDSVGNTGNFALGSPGAGSPRPLPTSGVAPATITTVELAPAAVGAAQIAANAVTGASIADGSLTSADISDGPRAIDATVSSISLLGTATTVASVTMAAPAAGRILANVSATYSGSPAGTVRRINCGLTTGTTVPFEPDRFYIDYSEIQGTFAATNMFSVASAGSTTIRVVCQEFLGETTLTGVQLNAIYVPQ